jgi:transcriptional regulator with XRE-family HTH domain
MENKEMYLKKIGANIRDIRKLKKQEPKEAAKGLGISVQAYGKFENGGTDFNITRIFEIAQYYKVEVIDILKANKGDIFNFTSQNNSGGYHVQKVGVLNITDEALKTYFENDIAQLKQKIVFFEEAIKKGK